MCGGLMIGMQCYLAHQAKRAQEFESEYGRCCFCGEQTKLKPKNREGMKEGNYGELKE